MATVSSAPAVILDREKCTRCGEHSVFYDELNGSTVCESCGNVVEEGALRNEEIGFEEPGQSHEKYKTKQATAHLLPRGYNPEHRRRANKRVAPIIRRLKIPERPYVEHAKELLKRIYETPLKFCSADYLAGLCVYIALRLAKQSKQEKKDAGTLSANVPNVPLSDVAVCLKANMNTLVKLYSKMLLYLKERLHETDPVPFVERISAKLNLPPQVEAEVSNDAILIVTLSMEASLHEGRKPSLIAAAALRICLEAREDPKPEHINDYAKRVNSTQITIRARMKELEGLLITVGKQILPASDDISRENLSQVLPLILRGIRAHQQALTASSAPLADEPDDLTSSTTALPNSNLSSTPPAMKSPSALTSIPRPSPVSTRTVAPLSSSTEPHHVPASSTLPNSASVTPAAAVPSKSAALTKSTSSASVLPINSSASSTTLPGVVLPGPQSYLRNSADRARRQKKLVAAKLRMKQVMGRCSAAIMVAMGWNTAAPNTSTPSDVKPDHNLDEEDFIIQRLLLEGVSEDAILAGYYQATAASSLKCAPSVIPPEVAASLDKPELGEHDVIPNDELARYINTSEEIEERRQWHEQLEATSTAKKRKLGLAGVDTHGEEMDEPDE